MTGERELHSDEGLLDAVREALGRAEPEPHDRLDAAIEFAYRMGDIDASVAQLVTDSSLLEPVGVRGDGDDTRRLRYELGSFAIELDLDESTGELVGQLLPPGSRPLTLVMGDGSLTVAVDALGRFRHTPVRPPFRLRIGDGADVVVTEWLMR